MGMSVCMCVCSEGYCLRQTGFSLISRWGEYNLRTILTEEPDRLNWLEKLTISVGIADAIRYCHQQNILHYDLQR